MPVNITIDFINLNPMISEVTYLIMLTIKLFLIITIKLHYINRNFLEKVLGQACLPS